MAQNYTEQLRKDNVRDAIYEDLQNNCEVLRTSWSGNAFPANPKVGQPCYRVDEDKLYYWDGYKWSQKGGGGSAELKTMELAAATSERVSITLEGARCLDKNMMFVFVDKIAQDPSTYSMNDDGTVVNFNPAIPANAAVTLRWFDTDVGTFDTAIFASDAEFAAGELTNRAPNVKQVHSFGDQIQTSNANYVKNELQSNLLNYTTNRILEIPQDIKLELNNGTLTLKAGSKVYVPNGAGKFDVVTLPNDFTATASSLSDRTGVVFVVNASGLAIGNILGCMSGTSTKTGWYYNTNDNKIYRDTLDEYISLPIALVTISSGQITSIDQVFNGFGYMGSTVFALPNIKVQGAFGVNENGTYKIKTFITDHVLTYSFEADGYGRYEFGFDVLENGTITYFGPYAEEIKTSEKQPSGLNFAWWNPIRGETHYVNFSGIDEKTPYCPSRLGRVNVSGVKIDSMTRNQTDSIVTSNALNFSQAGRSYLSGLGMPSGRYTDLTLGASGSTYTAPANGWFNLMKMAANNSENIRMIASSTNIISWGSTTNVNVALLLPVSAGDTVKITYSATGKVALFRFIYAEGSQPAT